MLKEWVKEEKPDDAELSERLEKARLALAVRQIKIKEKNLPVLVVIDGWGAAGKGSVLGSWIPAGGCGPCPFPLSAVLRRNVRTGRRYVPLRIPIFLR